MTRIILVGVLSCVLTGCATTSPQAVSSEPVVVTVAFHEGWTELNSSPYGTLQPQDLAAFAKEVGDRPVYAVPQWGSFTQITEFRDQLRAAGVKNVIIGPPPTK
jgi:hypothetical protein